MVKRSAAMLNVTWRRRSACGEPDLTMPPGSLNTYTDQDRVSVTRASSISRIKVSCPSNVAVPD